MKILIDFNSIYKRFFFSKYYIKKDETLEDKDFDFDEFYFNIISNINHLKYKFNVDRLDIFLIFDKKIDNRYWRNEIYEPYKSKKKSYNENMVELSKIYNNIVNTMKSDILRELYNVIEVDYVEADDIINILSKIIKIDKIIVSHDKDMKQLIDKNCVIYSPAEDKIINRYDKLDLIKHIIQGDDSDNIPGVFKQTSFTPHFIEFLQNNGIEDSDVFRVEQLKSFESLKKLYSEKYNKNIYKRDQYRLGKKIDTHINEILNMVKEDPLLKKHYIRNKILIDLSMIPNRYSSKIIECYKNRDVKGLDRIDINKINSSIKKLQLDLDYHTLL